VSKSSVQETKNPEPKLTLFSAMTPISVVAKQFHITPMGPMIGVMVSQEGC
jgi:hypothetical protein